MADKPQNNVAAESAATQLTHKLQEYAFGHVENLRDSGFVVDREAIIICVLAAEKLLNSFKAAAEYVNVDHQNT